MARGVNKVILIGNLGSDPEVRYTPDGVPVANFNLATSESWNDRNTGERQERTEWHRLVLWRKLAEIASQYLKKGSRIYVEGKLQTRSWDDQSGQKRYMTEVVVNDMQMLDSRSEGGGGGSRDAGYSDRPTGGQSAGPAAQPDAHLRRRVATTTTCRSRSLAGSFFHLWLAERVFPLVFGDCAGEGRDAGGLCRWFRRPGYRFFSRWPGGLVASRAL